MRAFLKKKGFTLIEVLIVVVIIGILAALILPRMLTQPERARVAEANQLLGTIRRAQVTYADATGAASTGGTVTGIALTGGTATGWSTIGMQDPGASGSFTYGCTAGTAGASGTCTATRSGGSLLNGTVTVDLTTGIFTCDGTKYIQATAPGGGCTTA